MALDPEIELYIDLFEMMLSNLKDSASKGVEMPLDQLIASFLPEEGDCHCMMLSVTLAMAVQRLVLTAADRVH